MRLKDWIIFIRVPNLFIIGLTMLCLHKLIFIERMARISAIITLTYNDLATLIICTLSAAIGGNIINDYYDRKLDLINKPNKTFIGTKLSTRRALLFYSASISISMFTAYNLGQRLEMMLLPFIIALINFSLWFYSAYLKKTLLLGNIIVSLLSAAVIIILFWVETYSVLERNKLLELENIVFAYALFAFWTSMVREIIKDKQDENGDKQIGAKTLAITMKEPILNKFLLLFLVPIAPVAILFYSQYLVGFQLILATIFLIIPYAKLLLLFKREDEYRWAKASLWTKLLMLGGLISLFFL